MDVVSVPLLMVRERSSPGWDSLGAGLSSRITSVLLLFLLWEECEERGRRLVLSMLSFRLAVLDDVVVDSACSDGVGEQSLNMWTVSLALLTQRRVLVALNAMLYMREGMLPRRNWYSFFADGTEKTRMMVPLSEAVARRVPALLRQMQERGERCAWMTLMAWSLRASKIKTSPFGEGIRFDVGGACGACEVVRLGGGTL